MIDDHRQRREAAQGVPRRYALVRGGGITSGVRAPDHRRRYDGKSA
jgi:hypothetical protein